jgi:hypothetical protein
MMFEIKKLIKICIILIVSSDAHAHFLKTQHNFLKNPLIRSFSNVIRRDFFPLVQQETISNTIRPVDRIFTLGDCCYIMAQVNKYTNSKGVSWHHSNPIYSSPFAWLLIENQDQFSNALNSEQEWIFRKKDFVLSTKIVEGKETQCMYNTRYTYAIPHVMEGTIIAGDGKKIKFPDNIITPKIWDTHFHAFHQKFYHQLKNFNTANDKKTLYLMCETRTRNVPELSTLKKMMNGILTTRKGNSDFTLVCLYPDDHQSQQPIDYLCGDARLQIRPAPLPEEIWPLSEEEECLWGNVLKQFPLKI